MDKKILILDGISGVSLGTEITEAFTEFDIKVEYTDAAILEKRIFNKLNSAIHKIIHRHLYKEDYYRHPKITNRSLKNIIDNRKPDIIFVIGFLYRFFDLNFIRQLKNQYAFKLYLYDTDSCNLFNSKRELLYFFNQELPIYDHIYSFSRTTTRLINNLNSVNASFFPFGAKPIIPSEENNSEENKKHDILFIGSADMRRIFLLEALVEQNLCVYGSKWQRNNDLMSHKLKKSIHHQAIWGKELHTVLQQSKIILNITRSTFYGVETGLNLRIFETLASGGFLLTDYCDELNELFTIGEHIESYRDAEELKDKVNYYLQHEEKRKKISLKGYEHFQKNFTWKARMKELLSKFQMT